MVYRGQEHVVDGADVGFGEFDVETDDFSVEEVKLFFVLNEGILVCEIERAEHINRAVEVVKRDFRHIEHFFAKLCHRDRGSGQEVFFEINEMRSVGVGFAFSFGQYLRHELDEQVGERKNYRNRYDVEERMEHSQLRGRNLREHLFEQYAESNCAVRRFAHNEPDEHKEDNARNVENEVNERGAFCVGGTSDTSDYRDHARADIAAHCEVDALVEGDKPRENHCDGNTRHNGRTLNYGGENRTYYYEKYGIFDCGEERLNAETFFFGEYRHRGTHYVECHENKSETEQYAAYLFDDVLFGEHNHTRADEGKRREYYRSRNGFAERAECDNLTRDCRTDVRAEYYCCGLGEGHKRRVDKTDYHNADGARALNCSRCDGAYSDSEEFAFGRFGKEGFEFVAADRFQIGAQNFGGNEENADTGEQRKYSGDDYCSHKSMRG